MKMKRSRVMKAKTATKVSPIRRRRRLRNRAAKVLTLVGLFTVLLMFSFVYKVEAFRVKVVEVSGVDRVSSDKIYDDANILIGRSLLTLPVKDIRDSILDKEPLLKGASVHRIVPSRVKIEIYERLPYAYVTNRRQYYLIDNEGIVIEKAVGRADPNLFLVESDSIKHAEVGEKLEFPNSDVFYRMTGVLDAHLDGRYSQVRFDQRGIKLFLRDGTYVLLGNGGEIDRKIMLVPIILQRLTAAGEKYEGLNLEYLEVPSFIKKGA